MTVVALPDSRSGPFFAKQVRDTASLRVWLAGRWAILFSHPDDFTQAQLEMDRWVSVLSRSFRSCGVAPVSLAHAGPDAGQGWLGRLGDFDHQAAAALALEPAHAGGFADPTAGALRARIARSGPRFALIADPALRCRRTLSYRLPAELPSPLELIGWAVALRKRDRAECSCCHVGIRKWNDAVTDSLLPPPVASGRPHPTGDQTCQQSRNRRAAAFRSSQ